MSYLCSIKHNTMIKNKDILIRVNLELKEKIQIKAKELGLSTSAFIRMIIKKEVDNA